MNIADIVHATLLVLFLIWSEILLFMYLNLRAKYEDMMSHKDKK